MRKLVIIVAATLMLAACGTQPTNENAKEMNTLTFTTEQAAFMSAIACNEAKADYTALAQAIDKGLDAGLTVSQVKEALSHLYAYTGFPRSLNALGTLQKVLEQRTPSSQATIEGDEATPLPSNFDALAQGTKVQTQLSGRAFDYAFCPAEDYYLKAHLFGDIFARDNLTHADRELITVSALSGLENVMPQLVAHVRGALNMGVTEEQLRSIPAALKAYGLVSEAHRAEAALATVIDGDTSLNSKLSTLNSSWPIGEPNTAYAQYFIGNSYLAVLDPATGLCNVSFEPGCRNNWHIHHGAVQMLICVSGRGWYQEWGKPAVELKPGVTIAVPEGVKHWHGAAMDSWMQHLTYHANAKPGNSNELMEQREQSDARINFAESRHKSSETQWLEPVSDEQYNTLQ